MDKFVLIVNDRLQLADLQPEAVGDLEIVTTATAKDGLAALALPSVWCAVLVAHRLADMTGLDFLRRAATLSAAIPLLLVPDDQLLDLTHQANSASCFRVVPESTPAAILATLLIDAARQFELSRQLDRLQAQVAQLDQLIGIDPLTGCGSRLSIRSRLQKELSRSIRYGHCLAIILCDIDALKNINLAHGQGNGDQVLAGFAASAQQNIRRDIDLIARWGEDEFLLVLPETPIQGAGRVAMRLQHHFAGCSFQLDGHTLTCSASFGVAGFTPEAPNRNTVIDDLLLIADRCLHQAKAAGGNQVLCCP